jgi:hypothetical protein
MVAEVFAGISAFKSMLDIAKSIKDMNDVAARQGAVIELREQILTAQTAQFALIEQVSTLKTNLAKFETWDAEKQQYELKDLGLGAFAFMLKPEARGAKPPHWVCTNCYADRRISIIQFTTKRSEGSSYLCPSCSSTIRPSSDAFETGTGRRCKWLD